MNLVLLNQHQTDGNACAAAMRTLTCRAKYDRQPIITQDGGTVALDWFQPRGPDKIPSDAPIVLILHGLTGDCHACGVQHIFSATTCLAKQALSSGPAQLCFQLPSTGSTGPACMFFGHFCFGNSCSTQYLETAADHSQSTLMP